jgi:hypothetical protein
MWWDLPWDRAVFRKVRSHQAEEKVGKPGEISREDWEGNNMADEWAGQGVPLVKSAKKARGIRALYGKAGEAAKEFATILEKWSGPEWDKMAKARQGKKGAKDLSGLGHKFAWIETMGAWACEECDKVKRVARQKTDREICKVKEMSQAGEERLRAKGGGGLHMSH